MLHNLKITAKHRRRPTDDIEWVREEIHIWIFSNLARKWRGISNRPIKFFRMFSGYHCKDEVVHAALARVGVTEKDLVCSDLPRILEGPHPWVVMRFDRNRISYPRVLSNRCGFYPRCDLVFHNDPRLVVTQT